MKIIKTLVIIHFTLLLACSHTPPGRGAGEVENSPQSQTSFKVETVAGNLEVPWSIVWAPDGRMIFTERPGRVRVYQNGRLQPQPLFIVPDVEPRGESGLMSIALHPHEHHPGAVHLGRGQLLRSRRQPPGGQRPHAGPGGWILHHPLYHRQLPGEHEAGPGA